MDCTPFYLRIVYKDVFYNFLTKVLHFQGTGLLVEVLVFICLNVFAVLWTAWGMCVHNRWTCILIMFTLIFIVI